MDLSQFGIGNTTNSSGTGGFSIPAVDNLQNTLNTIMLGAAVLSVLFVVLYIVSLVQRFRADRAMIAMRKDIAAIRAIAEQSGSSPRTPTPKLAAEQAATRDESVAA